MYFLKHVRTYLYLQADTYVYLQYLCNCKNMQVFVICKLSDFYVHLFISMYKYELVLSAIMYLQFYENLNFILFHSELDAWIYSKIKLLKVFFYLILICNLRGGIFMFSNVVFVTIHIQAKEFLLDNGRYGVQKKHNLMLISKINFLWKITQKKLLTKTWKIGTFLW